MSARQPSPRMENQLDLFSDYAVHGPAAVVDSTDLWRAERARQCEALALKIGVPLHTEVEVWLTQGIRLTGLLRLTEDPLWIEGSRDQIELRIGKATFMLGEVESIVRIS